MTESSIPAAQAPHNGQDARWRHLRTIIALMLREMSSRYGRTPGGYVWAILEPMGMIVLLSVGFSLLLRSPSLGNSFLLFYATGYLPFNLYIQTSNTTMLALTYSKALLKYPAVTWIDAVAARAILNILTNTLVAYILMVGILMIVESRTILDFGAILLSFVMAALLGLGTGLVNCALNGFFPIWSNIWRIVTRPLFLASGVIWIMEDLPPLAQDVLWYNPLLHITTVSRIGYYPTYDPQHTSLMFPVIVGLTLIALGLLVLRRYNLWILNAN